MWCVWVVCVFEECRGDGGVDEVRVGFDDFVVVFRGEIEVLCD